MELMKLLFSFGAGCVVGIVFGYVIGYSRGKKA